VRVRPVGDAAATVRVAAPVAFAADLLARRPAWLVDAVPTLDAVLVRWSGGSWGEVADALESWPEPEGSLDVGRAHVLPARYDGEDLDAVAAAVDLTVAEVVELHASVTYRVAMLGFLPGFPYLSGLPPALHLPRRPSPRVRVPAGSLAVAGAMTCVYPTASPGGWHLLGAVDVTLFDAGQDPPALLAPGDLVRFEPC
jgi:KipI family sensor histidine kinase inhibitor